MEQDKIISEEIRKKLRADFPAEAYSQHPTKSFLTTLKAMYVTERLNDVFGIGRWTIEHNVEIKTENYILLSGKLILLDYKCEIPKQFGGHKTTGTNIELADGYKSAVTDILSKSASYLEIGIDMFKGKIKTPSQKKYPTKPEKKYTAKQEKKWLNKNTPEFDNALKFFQGEGTIEKIREVYIVSKEVEQLLRDKADILKDEEPYEIFPKK